MIFSRPVSRLNNLCSGELLRAIESSIGREVGMAYEITLSSSSMIKVESEKVNVIEEMSKHDYRN